MPFDYLIGKYESGNYSVELHEWTEVDEQPAYKDFILNDATCMVGLRDQPFITHLRGEIQLQLLDESNYFRDKFKSFIPGKYYIKVDDGDRVQYAMPVANFISSKFWKSTSRRTFIFSDGIKSLQVQENTYSGYHQLGDLLYDLVNDVDFPELPLNIVMNYTPVGATGQSDILPQQIQVLPEDFIRKYENATKHDLLIEVLKYFGFQIWQENGEWWIVQRDIRDNNPTVYKRILSVWSTNSLNPTINIARKDLREEETEDGELEPVSRYTRSIQQPPYEFETLDPIFAIQNWTSGNPDHWLGTGDVRLDADSFGMIFEDVNPVRSQLISRIVKINDVIKIKIDADYTLRDDLTEGVYNWGILKIHAIDLSNTATDYWLTKAGTWSATEVTIGDQLGVLDPPSYTESKSLDLDLEVEMPTEFEGVIEITLELTGDDVFVASDPIKYNEVNVYEGALTPAVNRLEVVAALNNPQITNEEEATVSTTDTYLTSYRPSIKYYDGSDWQRVTDWDSVESSYQSIHLLVAENYLSQRSDYLRLYTLQVNNSLNLSLIDLITISEFHNDIDFIPFYIQRNRSSKRLVLQIAEKVSSEDLTVTFDTSTA